MKVLRERILLVENDLDVSDLIARQTLASIGYRVEVASTASAAIQQAAQFSPDVVIANLELPDLSGKDLLVALNSQGLDIPVIILAQKGMESDIIQAFRLGATDYLVWPVREAEVVSAVERVLKQVRARRERESLSRQLKQTNDELHQRVRELTTIFAIGKAVTSITDQHSLFEKIIEGAIYITEADCSWLLLREERDKAFVLSAQRNLPKSIAARLNQPWDDGISSLVALSGESFALHGEPIARFKVSQLGQAVLVVPVKIKKEVVGILVVVRKAQRPFSPSNKALLEAVADYASISLVNARLFRALEERARSLQQAAERAQANVRSKDEILTNLRNDLEPSLKNAIEAIHSLLVIENAHMSTTQKSVLRSSQEKLLRLSEMVETLSIEQLQT
jgi:two-component system, NtrC family, sensor kinase